MTILLTTPNLTLAPTITSANSSCRSSFSCSSPVTPPPHSTHFDLPCPPAVTMSASDGAWSGGKKGGLGMVRANSWSAKLESEESHDPVWEREMTRPGFKRARTGLSSFPLAQSTTLTPANTTHFLTFPTPTLTRSYSHPYRPTLQMTRSSTTTPSDQQSAAKPASHLRPTMHKSASSPHTPTLSCRKPPSRPSSPLIASVGRKAITMMRGTTWQCAYACSEGVCKGPGGGRKRAATISEGSRPRITLLSNPTTPTAPIGIKHDSAIDLVPTGGQSPGRIYAADDLLVRSPSSTSLLDMDATPVRQKCVSLDRVVSPAERKEEDERLERMWSVGGEVGLVGRYRSEGGYVVEMGGLRQSDFSTNLYLCGERTLKIDGDAADGTSELRHSITFPEKALMKAMSARWDDQGRLVVIVPRRPDTPEGGREELGHLCGNRSQIVF